MIDSSRRPRHRTRTVLGIVGLVAAGVAAALWAQRRGQQASGVPPAPVLRAQGYVGSASCGACHPHQQTRWSGSHHALAMRKASAATASGDFAAPPLSFEGEVHAARRDGDRLLLATEGSDGSAREYAVSYLFGVWPLQQVLVAGERGRMHAPLLAWDSRDAAEGGRRWFRLRPEDGRVPPTDLFHSFGPYQVWNSMCAECHSTGVRKNWDAANDRYETTWVEDGVGCEGCHGPGSAHVAYERGRLAGGSAISPPRFGFPVTLEETRAVSWALDRRRGIWIRDPVGRPAEHADVCARCHSRRGTIAEDDPGAPLHDTHRVALLEEGLYFADGQVQEEVFEHGSYLQSRMFAAGVGCFDCHGHASRARAGGAAQACANCHLREKFATPAHHFHTEGRPGARCVDCHMPTRTYMVVHARRDHSIRIPRPDLTVAIGTPNACNGCHADRDARWAAGQVERWWGPGVAARPHYGTAIDAGRRSAPGAAHALTGLIEDRKAPGIVRGTAAMLLARCTAADPQGSSRDVVPALETAALDVDPLVRRGAVEGAEGLPPPDLWRVLRPLLADRSRVVRIDAARHLAGTEAPTSDDRRRLATVLREAHTAAAYAADTPEGGMSVGNLSLAEGDLAGAERAFRAVIALAPGFVPAYVNLADVLRVRQRESDALRTLESGLERLPGAAPLHYALGLTLVRARRHVEAAAHLERAADLAPDDGRFALAWGLYLSDSGNAARAREVLDAALVRRPYDADLIVALASARAASGDRDGTIDLLRRLEGLRPRDGDLRAERERLERERER